VGKKQNDRQPRAIALAWLFHLVGDVHQPLHTVQLFSREYPRTVIVAAMKCAFGWHQGEHRSTFIGFGMD
jgi:hypothetical protein